MKKEEDGILCIRFFSFFVAELYEEERQNIAGGEDETINILSAAQEKDKREKVRKVLLDV